MIGIGMIAVVLASGSLIAGSGTSGETLKLLKTAMSSRVMIQNVAKDYLYIGKGVAVTKAKKEMASSLKAFDSKQKKLADSLNDPKIKNLMMFITMNVDEIKDTIAQPYSLDNAAVIVDLAEAVSEGENKIASVIRKNLHYTGPAFKGQRYDVTQIAKYYMAYQAGLKDDVTVQQMKKTVEHFQKILPGLASNKNNTPKMNQIINKVEKQWKIVHQFYLDIEEGGLPLIVYQTSRKLDKNLLSYAQEVVKSQGARKGK